MALSTKKLGILNRLPKYLAEMRKGQFSPAEGGDIRLGDLLGNYSLFASGSAVMNAAAVTVDIPGLLASDFAVAVIDVDDGGGGATPLICIAASCAAGELTLAPEVGAPGGAAPGSAKYFVFRAQE